MKVSICCITYNQEKYIAQALEGFLMQKLEYDYEIIISDDCSTDDTPKICLDYQRKYPDKIRLIINESNIGMTPNFVQAIKLGKGEYLAICEGDDYWTDPYKLKRQIVFLDTNREYVGIFHNTEERYEDNDDEPSFLYCGFSSARAITFQDMVNGNVVPTCSIVFKNKIFEEFPKWYYELKMADWPLHLLNLQFGNYWYMPQVMGVHRLHSLGVWGMKDPDRNNKYVSQAYEIMLGNFENDRNQTDYLRIAQKRFNDGIELKKTGLSFKEKVKNILIRVIRKF